MTRTAGPFVAMLATLNVLVWGLLVPPFHVPDEPAHVFYAQYVGETGKLPRVRSGVDWYSADINAVLGAGGFYYVVSEASNRPRWGPRMRQGIAEANGMDRVGTGNAATASSNPPLYYMAQAAVYRAARGLPVTERLALMRVLSALVAGLTVLCIYHFLRELLPGAPLAWSTGALLAGLQPMFAFISSGVNNDGGLFLAVAALLLVLARVLRRGLTARRAAAVGLLLGGGVLVKTQMLAFAPAAALALALAAWRSRDGRALFGVVAGALPLLAYGVLGATTWQRPLIDRVNAVTTPVPAASAYSGSPFEQASYVWQEYLPRLPLMPHLLPASHSWRLWFKGLVGNFGWLDYGYPAGAYYLALAIALAVLGAAGTFLWRRRGSLDIGELAVYGLAAAGLAIAIGVVSYRAVASTGQPFEQARYLLPLLPLFVLVPAVAVRAAGARAAPLAAALMIVALGYSVLAQLLTVARYYG